jgi:multidrug efflux system outer membrane protein
MDPSVGFASARHQRRVIARAVACGLLLVLPSCHIPKLRQAEVGLDLPASFNGAASADSSAQLRVDEFYNDPVLTRLVCDALASNRELKILEEEVQVARAETLSRRGAFLPLVGLRAGAGWDRHSAFTPEGAAERELEYRPGRRFPATPGDSLVGFNFLIPLDIWRELRNARDAATQRYLAAIERRTDFLTRMVADIAESYYNLMALDARLATLDQTIALQEQSLRVAEKNFAAGRGTELPVQRFQAEVRKNQSEKLIVRQEIVETENRINFLAGRVPQPVARNSARFFELNVSALSVGVTAQLLLNRPDIRQAEREVAAAELDVKVARANFFPRLDITGGVGYRAFNPRYLFNPEAFVLNAAGELTAPLINKAAIRADYLAANARQLESVYNYQRVILNAFTEVNNRLAAVQNYSRSIEIKRQQLAALESSVEIATKLFQAARVEYIEVLFAQRDLLEARTVLIDTKRRQLSAVVNAYQALGGGSVVSCPAPDQHPGAGVPQRLPEVEPMPPPRLIKDSPEPRPAEPRPAKDPPALPRLPTPKEPAGP